MKTDRRFANAKKYCGILLWGLRPNQPYFEVVVMNLEPPYNTCMAFPPHGDYEIHKLGRVLLIRLIGTWNSERYTEYLQSISKAVESMGKSPFAAVFDNRDWGMGVSEMFADQQERIKKKAFPVVTNQFL